MSIPNIMLPPKKSASNKPNIQHIDLTQHTFTQPTKQITTAPHIAVWHNSTTYNELLQFIASINTSVHGHTWSESIELSTTIQSIIQWLQQLQSSIAQYPPIKQEMRYGNKGYRNWYDYMKHQCTVLNAQLCSNNDCVNELNAYLMDSFGNYQRIDYGTGHELNFILYLLCLYKLNILQYSDILAIGLRVIRTYLTLMQTVQLTYYLEPAGSKGAWGLDDYQFLIFLFGTSQLIGSDIQCSDIVNADKVATLANEYLLFSGIQFIHKVKSGPFYEHSAMLYQISQLTSWTKANNGLIQMYNNEVLNKFPIVQHILFGSILTLQPAPKQQT